MIKKKEASQISEQINGKEYEVKKLSTENNELYGSEFFNFVFLTVN